MTISDIIKKINEGKEKTNDKYKEMEENYRLEKTLMERQKSSNERELQRYYKENREKQIKEQLDHIRKKKSEEMWKGNIFNDKASILKEDNQILKAKNIFIDNRNDVPLSKKGDMFFKW